MLYFTQKKLGTNVMKIRFHLQDDWFQPAENHIMLLYYLFQVYHKETSRTEKVCDRFKCKDMSGRREAM